jgi:hypothetical protein
LLEKYRPYKQWHEDNCVFFTVVILPRINATLQLKLIVIIIIIKYAVQSSLPVTELILTYRTSNTRRTGDNVQHRVDVSIKKIMQEIMNSSNLAILTAEGNALGCPLSVASTHSARRSKELEATFTGIRGHSLGSQ